MRVTVIFVLLLTAMNIIALKSSAEGSGKEVFWYEVSVQHGNGTYSFIGTSTLNIEVLIQKLKESGFIRLNNLVYPSESTGKVIYYDWKEWDPVKKPQIYLNSRYVIYVQPLTGDPKSSEILKKKSK